MTLQCFRCYRPLRDGETRWFSDDDVPPNGSHQPDNHKQVVLCDSCHTFVTLKASAERELERDAENYETKPFRSQMLDDRTEYD